MKKLLIASLLFLSSPSLAVVTDFTNQCGNEGYAKLAASFSPIQYSCDSGEYLPADSLGQCTSCPRGYTCVGGTYPFNENYNQGIVVNSYTCDSGEYLPANSLGCIACPRGYTCVGGTYPFNENYNQGNVANSYTCDSGEYLPANALGCSACPAGATCDGGTYSFNANIPQGVTYNAPFTQNQNDLCSHPYIFARADFSPIQYTCSAGNYLPANGIECVQCPVNNICAGGTYSFNETVAQGIQSCASGTFAPTGSAVCYPHILHVGNDNIYLKSTKQTTPSLNIRIGNDVFYANMTTTRTRMNKDSSHYFHVQWDNNDYYVCDDTTCPQ